MNSFLINPYEAIGTAHTEGLNYVAGKLSAIPKIDEVVRLSAEFACRQIRADNSFSNAELYSTMAIVSFCIDHINDIQSVYASANLNQQQIVFLERMLTRNPYIKIDEQLNRFRLIEGEIFAYPMPYKEKEILLIASAVGKHSGEYWNTEFNSPGSKWKAFFPTPNDPGGPLAKKTWASEDAKGAVAGGIAGGIAGGVTGGLPGAGIGVVVGAIGGCIGESVASLIFD